MNTAATDIATLLAENGFGTVGADIFVGTDIPPKPDPIIRIIDSGSFLPDIANLEYSYPTVQVVVRGAKGGYQACSDRADQVHQYLQGNVSISSIENVNYVYVFHISGPIDIGYDDNVRPRLALNYRIMRGR